MNLKPKFLQLLLLFCSCFQATTLKSQTIIPGGAVSGVWDLAGSPYLVQAAIIVVDGATLAIEPGVQIQFQGSYKFLIMGRLLAVGTVADSIEFTAADTTDGWLGVRFESTSATNDTSRFEYCKFQYGKANGTSSITLGGAIFIEYYSKVVISHSYFTNCYASGSGGAISFNDGDPVISNNSFINNTASWSGGGIFCYNSNAILTNNLFSNNNIINSVGRGGGIASGGLGTVYIIGNTFINNNASRGGGFFNSSGRAYVDNNTFSGNTGESASCISLEFAVAFITYNTFTGNAGYQAIYCESDSQLIAHNDISNNTGGGILCTSNCRTTISDNTIDNNTGIGILVRNNNPSSAVVYIFRNFISRNTARHGAGIYFFNGGTHTVSNNIICNNLADSLGGAIYCNTTSPVFFNNTIVNNQAFKGGALYCTANADPTFENCILWGNMATSGDQVYLYDEPSDPPFNYSDVEGGSAAFQTSSNVFYLGAYTNNLDVNPLFQNPAAGVGPAYASLPLDWNLLAGSVCIDGGNPSGTYPGTDILGNPRVANGVVDMGAIEYLNTGYGISEKEYFSIYPNPASGKFYINSATAIEKVEIIDAKGSLVKQLYGTNEFDITQYPDGIFTARIFYKNKVVNSKILKSQ